MKRGVSLMVLAVSLIWISTGCCAAAADPDNSPADVREELRSLLDLEELQDGLSGISGGSEFSFSEMVEALLHGELPFEPEQILPALSDLFFGQMQRQRQTALRILVIVVASAVFSNFVKVFDSSQIADISFFMVYLLISTFLMKSFLEMNETVVQTCGAINKFMRLLLPSYLTTVVLSSGSITAVGFYEITLLGMQLLQALLVRMILPAINFYLVLLLLNQMSEEDYFSKLAELVETLVVWATKGMLGVVTGLQAVQLLIAPAVDSLKKTTFQRLARTLPGVGNILDSAAETVAGSAVVIKNAVGIAGMLAILGLCAAPLLKLLSGILIFRLLCALIQPFSEKRMVEGIASISRGTVLLLRILATAMSVFLLSLAMITAAVRGG